MFHRPTSTPPARLFVDASAPVLVAASPQGQALAQSLAQRYPLNIQGGNWALESQQQDEAAKQAALDEVKQTIAQYDKDHPATGPLHVYLMDGKVAASTDDDGSAMMRALVSRALTAPSRTVAALLPEDTSCTSVDDLSPGSMLGALAATVLAVEGLTLVVGQAALESVLDAHLNPSAEEDADAVALEGMGDAVRAFRRFFSSRARHPDGLPRSPNLDVSAVVAKDYAKTYLNPGWLSNQSLRTESLNGHGIAEHLVVNGQLPANPADAVTASTTMLRTIITNQVAAMAKYLTGLESLAQHEARAGRGGDTPNQKPPVSPVKAADGAVLAKIPGSWQFHLTDDDVAVRPVDRKALDRVPALTAPQVAQYAQVSLRTMRAAYELSRDINEHLRAQFNHIVDLSRDNAFVSSLSSHTANELKAAAKGKGVWVLFDYCSVMLEQAAALQRWCYTAVGGKGALESLTTEDQTPGFKQAKDGELDPATESAAAIALTAGAAVAAFAAAHAVGRLINKAFDALGKAVTPTASATIVREGKAALRESVSTTYLNPKWIEKATFQPGPIDAHALGSLLHGKSVTTTPAASVRQHLAAVTAQLTHYAKVMTAYAHQVNPVLEAMVKMPDPKAAVAWGEKQLANVPTPSKVFTFNVTGLLGNPSLRSSERENWIAFTGKVDGLKAPALTATEVPAVGQAIIDALDAAERVRGIIRSIPRIHDGEDPILRGKDELWDEIVDSKIANYFWHSDHHNGHRAVAWDLETSIADIAKALNQWVQESVGNKTAHEALIESDAATESLAMAAGGLAAFGLMALVGFVGGRIKRSMALKGSLSKDVDQAIEQLEHRLKAQYGNLKWLAERTFHTKPIAGQFIAKHLHLIKPVHDPVKSAWDAAHSVDQWAEAYTRQLEQRLKQLLALGKQAIQQAGNADLSPAQTLELAKTVKTLVDPKKTAPFHGQGFLAGSRYGSFPGSDTITITELPPLNAAQVKAAAEAVGHLIRTANRLRELYDRMNYETYDLVDPETSGGDGTGGELDQALGVVWRAFDAKEVRHHYTDPYFELVEAVEGQAMGLAHWIEASIDPHAPAKESLDEGDDQPALEAIDLMLLGKVVTSLLVGRLIGYIVGRLFNNLVNLITKRSRKQAHASAGKQARNELREDDADEDVRNLHRVLKYSYSNPKWVARQDFRTTPISNAGLQALLDGDHVAEHPAAAVHTHVKVVLAMLQKYVGALRDYAHRVNPIAEQMVRMRDTSQAVAWGKSQLKSIPLPDDLVSFDLHGTLGNLSIQKNPTKLVSGEAKSNADATVRALTAADMPEVSTALLAGVEALQSAQRKFESLPSIHESKDPIFTENKTLWHAMEEAGLDAYFRLEAHQKGHHQIMTDLLGTVEHVTLALNHYVKASIR